MKIDLTCPAEVLGACIVAGEHGRRTVELDILNISRHPIRRIELYAAWVDADGAVIDENTLVFSGLRIVAHGRTTLSADCGQPEAAGLIAEPRSVAFADYSEGWDYDPKGVTEYEFTTEPEGPRLTRLRNVAGEDAVCYPAQKGRYWLCVCGRLNSDAAEECVRCLRGRERLFSVLADDEASDDADWTQFESNLRRHEKYSARREEMLRQHEKSRRRRRDRNIKIVTGALLTLLVLAAIGAIALFLKPELLAYDFR